MKNLSIVIVSALFLVLTACGSDDKGGSKILSATDCGQMFSYNAAYSRSKNVSTYGAVVANDKYYSNTADQGNMYIQTSSDSVDIYESESGDQSYTCDRPVQSTYSPQSTAGSNYPATQPTAPVYNQTVQQPTYNNSPAPAPSRYSH